MARKKADPWAGLCSLPKGAPTIEEHEKECAELNRLSHSRCFPRDGEDIENPSVKRGEPS